MDKDNDKIISSEDIEEVSGGVHAVDYYRRPVHCRECGYDDFTCLGWKREPSGNSSEGYKYRCNKCGYEFMVYEL